ncbi:MAG: RidA family protein [Proteobacteria bacterium]|nr:RidA family protein [Pseudomonadota bacterium]
MNTMRNPANVAKPFSSYSQALETPAKARWLHISGQVGIKPDGTMAQGIEGQATQAWTNIVNCLTDAGMVVGDLVKVTSFLVRAGDVAAVRPIRDRFQGGWRPASTLVVVAGLASPEWLIEIEAIAAKLEPAADRGH